MAFIDNSGNIILDMVLTDTGRARLSRGDGTFKIVKFALGDDEIDYSNYNKDHASGSAYYDLAILQTPVFEAFTNNASAMKSKLISINRTNLLYLPVVKLNEVFEQSCQQHVSGCFVVCVDEETETAYQAITQQGVIKGANPGSGGSYIRLDQGLDTLAISPANVIDPDLIETQYIVEIDNRLGSVVSKGGVGASVSYIDDDNIASYFFALGNDLEFVKENTDNTENNQNQTIAGPRGTIIEFKIKSSLELDTSTYLFNLLGATGTGAWSGYYYIDANIRITGATTGFGVDVGVRFLKQA